MLLSGMWSCVQCGRNEMPPENTPNHFLGCLTHPLGQEAMAYGSYVLVAVVLAMTSAWLCRTFARYAAGSGIPEIKTILGMLFLYGGLGASGDRTSSTTSPLECV